MAADSSTIANPVWIQIMTTMRKRVFQGELMRNCCGSPPSQTST